MRAVLSLCLMCFALMACRETSNVTQIKEGVYDVKGIATSQNGAHDSARRKAYKEGDRFCGQIDGKKAAIIEVRDGKFEHWPKKIESIVTFTCLDRNDPRLATRNETMLDRMKVDAAAGSDPLAELEPQAGHRAGPYD